MGNKKRALYHAFIHSLPVCAGFTFLGIAYGIYMNAMGFSFFYPMFMSMFIFAGSMQFVATDLFAAGFAPVEAFLMTLMVNARHLFYGISMLDKYRGQGKKTFYLIFGMCDETFSVNFSAEIPPDVDRGWFMFFVTLLDQLYWFVGSVAGGIFGEFIPFNTSGIEFSMTALFVVIFVDQWRKEKNHAPAIIGVAGAAICLVLFGADSFLLPAMAVVLIALTVSRKWLEKAGEAA